MTLRQQLDDQADALMNSLPNESRMAFTRTNDELMVMRLIDQAKKAPDTAPEFVLPNAVGDPVSLDQLLARGPVVLTFFRGSWCPFCNLALRALQEALPEISEAGATLVAISPQRPDHSLSLVEKHSLTFEVLTDSGNEVAKRYGASYTLPDFLRPVFVTMGIDIEAHNGSGAFDLPLTATYVITRDRKIHYAFLDVDFTKRAEPAEILRVLRQLPVGV